MCTLRTLKTPRQLEIEEEQAYQGRCPGKIQNSNPSFDSKKKKNGRLALHCGDNVSVRAKLGKIDTKVKCLKGTEKKMCKYKIQIRNRNFCSLTLNLEHQSIT